MREGPTSNGNAMKVINGYGMSELTVSATGANAFPGMCDGRVIGVIPEGSVGILMPGMEIRIVIEDEQEAGLGSSKGNNLKAKPKFRDAELEEVGELWLRGANIALGYYKDEIATGATFDWSTGDSSGGGWLHVRL